MSKIYDSIIVGYGPAGTTASIYLKRFNHDCLLIGKDYGVLSLGNDIIENYYGFDSISGVDLIKKGLNQAKKLGVDILKAVVISINKYDTHFEVETSLGVYQSRTVLLATGKSKTSLNIPNFNKFLGKGISFCAVCDGFFYRNKSLGIIGTDHYMLHELKVLENFTKNITIFTNGEELTTSVEYPVVKDKLIKVHGLEKISEIETTNTKYAVDGLFVAIDAPSSLEFSKSMGILMEKNHIIVNADYMTNIEGLYAAGDIIGGKLQITKASHDGMQAAYSISKQLKKKPISNI